MEKQEKRFNSAQDEDHLITAALAVLERRLQYRSGGDTLSSPSDTRSYLRLRMAELQHEVFACLFLDNRHRVIAYDELFRGTIDGCSVHPREVVKQALARNSAAVIFAHNHPSGIAEPSRADERLTRRLREALALVDIRVLDHLIVGHDSVVSFAEGGLL